MSERWSWPDCWLFFFKQMTAYEGRISDWSSDVCSSDLYAIGADDRRPFQPADRADDDDRPLAAFEHLGRDHGDQPVVRQDIIVHDLAELVVADPEAGAIIGVRCGVADERGDLAEGGARFVHQILKIVQIGRAHV